MRTTDNESCDRCGKGIPGGCRTCADCRLIRQADSLGSLLWHRYTRKDNIPADLAFDIEKLLTDLRREAERKPAARRVAREQAREAVVEELRRCVDVLNHVPQAFAKRSLWARVQDAAQRAENALRALDAAEQQL